MRRVTGRAGQRRCRGRHERGTGGGLRIECSQKSGGRPGLDERHAQAVADKVVNQRLLAEAHLSLGRVHVHIHLFGRHFEEQEHDWKAGGRNHIAIRLREGVQKQPVANKPLVYKNIDGIAIELLKLGLGVEPGQPHRAGNAHRLVWIHFPRRRLGQAGTFERSFGGKGQKLPQCLLPKNLINPFGSPRNGRGGQQRMAGRNQFEVLFGMNQGIVGHQRRNMGQLCRLRAQKFSPGGRIEEQIGDGEGGSLGQSGFLDVQNPAARDLHARSRNGRSFIRRRFQGYARHRGN